MKLYRKAKRSAAAIFFEKERESIFKLLITKKGSVYLVEVCARTVKTSGGKLPPLLNGQLILLSVNKAKVGHFTDCTGVLETTQGSSEPVARLVRGKKSLPKMDPTTFGGYYPAMPSIPSSMRYPYPASSMASPTSRGMIFYPKAMSGSDTSERSDPPSGSK